MDFGAISVVIQAGIVQNIELEAKFVVHPVDY
jgi:hypothetical protein